MSLSWLLAAAHLLALGIGLGAVCARGAALGAPLDKTAVGRVLAADNWWGVAALLWIVTGLARTFGGFEKGADYYLQNELFWTKMLLFGLILILELWPMITFARWRIQRARGVAPDTRHAAAFARISYVEGALVAAMVLFATGMARGYGALA